MEQADLLHCQSLPNSQPSVTCHTVGRSQQPRLHLILGRNGADGLSRTHYMYDHEHITSEQTMRRHGVFILFFLKKEKSQKKNFLRKAYALLVIFSLADARI